MRNILLASAAAPALLYALPSQAQTCTAAPDCATLGYTKTASQCSGKSYTRCPFDTSKYACDTPTTTECYELGFTDSKANCPGNYVACPGNDTYVRCLQDAKPGDLKYSLRTSNHDGWLLCNGATYKPEEYPELYAVIGESFGKKLPNYVGYFLKGAATGSATTLAYGQLDSLPSIKGEGPMLDDYARDQVTISGAFYEGYPGKSYDAQSSHEINWSRLMFDASRSSSVYKGRIQNIDAQGNKTTSVVNASKVIPANYPANIFIYAGRKVSGQNSCEKAGYLSSYPDGLECSIVYTEGVRCYKDCKPSLWGTCINKYPINDMMCYDAKYEDCRVDQSAIHLSDLDDVCAVFEGSLFSSCSMDEQCLSSQYGI